MSLETIAAYATAAAAISAIIVQLLKEGVIDPRMGESPERTALLRAITYLLNFGLLVLVLITNHAWEWSSLFFYIVVSFDGTIVAHVGYKLMTRNLGEINVAPTPPLTMGGASQQTTENRSGGFTDDPARVAIQDAPSASKPRKPLR